ncbi:MAG: PAS domain S-box protein [Gallionella sp.]|nr:PAS domain S-box protein [Gallionella sp.]
MDNWQYLFDRRNRPAWVVLLICLSLAIAAWYGLRMQAAKNASQQFELHVHDVIDSIEERLRQHEQILLGGAGLFNASESVNRSEWRSYVERLNLKDNYPGIQGVGFSRIIRPAELQAHIATIRAEGFPEYTVRPPGERPLYTSIIYLEPFAGRNLVAFGYDMMSEATRAKAMSMAAESGKTAITGKVKLVQETHGKEQAGFLMYVPVYRKHQPLVTPEDRWKALQGFVFSPYRVDDLMAGILGKQRPMLDFTIFDGEKETDNASMFVSAEEQAAKTRITPPELSALRTIQAYGNTWTIRLHSRPEFEAGFQSPLNTVILALGGGISVLLFTLVSFLVSRRERAEEMAVGMTRQIRENEKHLTEINNRFELAADSAGIGVWDYDVVTGNLIWDSWMYRLYQVEKGEFEGAYMAWKSRLHPEDAERSEAELRAAIESGKNFDSTFRIVWKNGEVRHIKAHARVERDQKNRSARMIGINYDVTERKRIEKELDKRLHDLGERVKEQRCLYQLSSLSREIALPLEEYFSRAVNLLPPAWQYPEYACARITWNGREYASGNYAASDWRMVAPIALGGVELGMVEVCYLRDMPAEHEGPFLLEERELIDAVASHVRQILEMRQSEVALRESEQLVRSIVENVVDGLITIDERGVVKSFNKAAEGIFGYAAAEVIGNNIRMLMPEPYHSEHDGYLHNYLSTGKKKIIGIGREVAGKRKNGKTFPMDLAVSEMQMADRRVFIGLVRDITERKNTVEAIARISNFNRAIIDGAEHLIITTGKDGIIQSFNRSAETHLGYKAEELIGKATPALFHDADEVVRRAHELRKFGISVEPGFEVFVVRAKQLFGGDTHEWTYIRKDGSRFPVVLTVTALRDGQGEINAYLGIATDITERKKSEDELRKLSRAVEQSPVSVMITNAKGNIEYVNAKFSEITGYTAQEVMGRNPRIIQSGLTTAMVYQSMWQTILGGQQWRGKLQNRKKSGELFWEEIYISAIRDSEGKTTNFVAVKEDITERMKIERMKNEFISTVSHELRTPLTSIRGALALIAGGVVGELPAAVKPLVDIAHKNSERLILLVNDILDIEKIEAGKMEFTAKPVKLMPLLHQALDGNRAYAEQYKVGYELEGEPPDVMVNVDANRLMQVFANLLSNAAKFSPAGSRVLVAAEHIDQRIRVMVKDNGPGIPDEFKGRIFQKFAQADSSDTRKKGGTGLGLSITKAIVEQMGGSIGFESQPNVQTVFYVEFPEWVERKLPEISHRNDGSVQRVLVCEDSRDAATILRTMLEQGGYGVDIAYDASQAKQLLAQGNYAAMTLDLALPGQSGISLIHELRGQEVNANLPILVVSARAAEAMREPHGEQLGGVEWIDKPINQDRLFFALNRVAGRPGHTCPKVLHIEDDPDVFHVVSEVASKMADMEQARNLAEARQMLAKCHYDLVILDLELPDGSGKELLPLLKGALPPIPVLVFSAYEIGQAEAKEVSAALVKSRTDNEQLRTTIKRLIGAE